MLDAKFRPLEVRPDAPRGGHKRSPFSGSFTDTLDRLERELDHLKAAEIVVQIDTTLDQIRNDGWPRSTARVNGNAVVLSFRSRHGALSYTCNTYQGWEQNLRAIAMTLERLRAVERYGAVKGGEQYKGWAQLPPGQNGRGPIQAGEWRSVEDAARFILRTEGCIHDADGIAAVIADPQGSYREAARKAHPDVGGSTELMAKLNRARDFIVSHTGGR